MTDSQKGPMDEVSDGKEEICMNLISALDEDDDDEDQLVERVPEDVAQLQACITAAQGCLLLLMLKQHIKDIYGLSDRLICTYKVIPFPKSRFIF